MNDPAAVDFDMLLSALRRAEWIDLKGWNQDERIEGPELECVVLAVENLCTARGADKREDENDRNAYGNLVANQN